MARTSDLPLSKPSFSPEPSKKAPLIGDFLRGPNNNPGGKKKRIICTRRGIARALRKERIRERLYPSRNPKTSIIN